MSLSFLHVTMMNNKATDCPHLLQVLNNCAYSYAVSNQLGVTVFNLPSGGSHEL